MDTPLLDETVLSCAFRWPTRELRQAFRQLACAFQSEFCLEQGLTPKNALDQVFERVCCFFEKAPFAEAEVRSQHARKCLEEVSRWLASLPADDRMQALASLLGMIAHFEADGDRLVNSRRPQKKYSTYPNSPLLTRIIAAYVVPGLIRKPMPGCLSSQVEIDAFVSRAFDFRLVDPSVESGQLLLACAEAALRHVMENVKLPSDLTQTLMKAVVSKCADCFWGYDKSRRALRTVRTAFHQLGRQVGVPVLASPHVRAENSLKLMGCRTQATFDGIVNNPPWGASLCQEDRRLLRERFEGTTRLPDTYIAFIELALHLLKEGGRYALVVPAHVVAAANAARVRDMLLKRSRLEHVVLLPRDAFAEATVRGVLLLGKKSGVGSTKRVALTQYPVAKNMRRSQAPEHRWIAGKILSQAGGRSWLPYVTLQPPRYKTVPLGSVACIRIGIQMYRLGKGRPRQTRAVVDEKSYSFTYAAPGTEPAIKGKQVQAFYLLPPEDYIRFGKWLSWIGDHAEIRKQPRVLVRELYHRSGRLSAAATQMPFYALHGVYSIVPGLVDIHVLAALLNSKMMAAHVAAQSAAFHKVAFQRITTAELRALPIPEAAVVTGRAEMGLAPHTNTAKHGCERIVSLSKRIAEKRGHTQLEEELEDAIVELYAL